MKQHALSGLFPSLPLPELKALAADIKANGLKSAITTYKGEVLDGWHRYLACRIAGVKPLTVDYRGGKPMEFVKSMNWHRRHLSASQRALAEVQLSEWLPEGQRPSTPSREGVEKTRSAAEMAAEARVSEATIERAKVVDASGSAVLKEAVREGEISVKRAAVIATLPRAEQAMAMAEPREKPRPREKEEFAPDLAAELERADGEIRGLQALVESLKKDDLAKEVVRWRDKFERLEGRVRQLMTTEAEAKKQAAYATGLLAQIRRALKVERDRDILPALTKK